VQLDVDTSALVKLVSAEPESAAITRTELVRAPARLRDADVARYAALLPPDSNSSRFSTALLRAAAVLPRPELRALDAIHLAAALTAPDLRAFVTYDRRLADAGVVVVSPA
jgi:predicted nucleic acid-binding protein